MQLRKRGLTKVDCEVKRQAGERSMYFDVLRCISMFAVVGVHVYGSLLPSAGGVNPILSSIVEHFNSLGVFFFFAISGYFALQNEYKEIGYYYKKRFIRILVPYFFYAAIYTVYFTGIEGRDILGIIWGKDSYIVRIFTANVHGTHWFVYAILFFYLCVPYMNKMMRALSKKEIKKLYIGIWVVVIICYFMKYFRDYLGLKEGLDIDNALWLMKTFLIFSTGYIVNRVFTVRLNISLKLLLGLLAFVGYCVNIPLAEYILLMIVMMDVTFEKKQGFLRSCIDQLTEQSYSIYLIHAAILSFLLRITVNFEMTFWVKEIGICGLTVIMSYLVTKIIDWLCTKRFIKYLEH